MLDVYCCTAGTVHAVTSKVGVPRCSVASASDGAGCASLPPLGVGTGAPSATCTNTTSSLVRFSSGPPCFNTSGQSSNSLQRAFFLQTCVLLTINQPCRANPTNNVVTATAFHATSVNATCRTTIRMGRGQGTS